MSGRRAPGRAVRAGIAYFAVVFAAGFALGAMRTLVLASRLGPLGAVLVELPVMLAISWAACGWLVARFSVGPALGDRLLMGAVAFVLLIAAELVLFLVLSGGPVAGFFASYAAPAGAAGLAGQVAFAAMPLLVRRR